MSIVVDRETKQIETCDTVEAIANQDRWLVYHTRTPPKEVYACPPQYRVIDGNDVRVATEAERATIDAEIAVAQAAEETKRWNAAIEQAKAIVDDPQSPEMLAVRAALDEIVDELRAAKTGKPKPLRTDEELRAAAKARLEAMKRV